MSWVDQFLVKESIEDIIDRNMILLDSSLGKKLPELDWSDGIMPYYDISLPSSQNVSIDEENLSNVLNLYRGVYLKNNAELYFYPYIQFINSKTGTIKNPNTPVEQLKVKGCCNIEDYSFLTFVPTFVIENKGGNGVNKDYIENLVISESNVFLSYISHELKHLYNYSMYKKIMKNEKLTYEQIFNLLMFDEITAYIQQKILLNMYDKEFQKQYKNDNFAFYFANWIMEWKTLKIDIYINQTNELLQNGLYKNDVASTHTEEMDSIYKKIINSYSKFEIYNPVTKTISKENFSKYFKKIDFSDFANTDNQLGKNKNEIFKEISKKKHVKD